MFEPMILPTDMPKNPFFAAVMLTASSGRDVPAATMVAPIIVFR